MSENHNSKKITSSRVAKTETQLVRQEVAATYHRGPLPDPVDFSEYEKICPGAADRIIKMAENQSAHRQKIEQSIVSIQNRNSLIGIIFAFIIGMTVISGGIYIVINGQTTGKVIAGTLFSGAGLAGLVGAFIYGTSFKNKQKIVLYVMRIKMRE
jgi:uncharacterized membrane protein